MSVSSGGCEGGDVVVFDGNVPAVSERSVALARLFEVSSGLISFFSIDLAVSSLAVSLSFSLPLH